MATHQPAALSCPVCGERRRMAPELSGLERCGTCSHVWAPLGAADNRVFESEEYVTWRTAGPTQLRRQARIVDQRLRSVWDLLPVTGRSLEIGCSTGEVVEALGRRSWSAYGIDLSEVAIALGRERHPHARLAVGIDPAGAGFPPEGYDLLCAFHVVEHLADLGSFAALVDRALTPGGLVYLRVPNWHSWSRRVFRSRWPSLVREHLHHFSATSMAVWLDSLGLDAVRLGTHGDAREWAGGLRRCLTGPDPSGAYQPAGSGAFRALEALETLGRPLFWMEERCGRGSELVVVAKKRR